MHCIQAPYGHVRTYLTNVQMPLLLLFIDILYMSSSSLYLEHTLVLGLLHMQGMYHHCGVADPVQSNQDG
jgi:hypothetical protein